MKIYDVVQGSSEWLRIRAGIPTASEFDKIITATGRPSGQREKYMYLLLAERLMGEPAVSHVSFWMERGSDLEARAVRYYEFERGMDTVPVGFVTDEEGHFGASPDRFVGDTGLLEIKCPSEAVHLMYLLGSGSAYEEYKIQVQGQLFVTERLWADLLSWHPRMPPALIHIELDAKFIEKMIPLLEDFSGRLEKMTPLLDEIRMPTMRSVHERKLTDELKASLIHIKGDQVINHDEEP
jgi:putative phage-type endonuclease